MKNWCFFLLLFGTMANAQIVTIPDANFKSRLLSANVDTNFDGEIQVSEALAVTTLNVSGANISDLTGIEAFTNLLGLDCSNNQIIGLDLTSLTALQGLYVDFNPLVSLNISNLSSLLYLDAESTSLSSFNFNGLTSINNIIISNSNLTTLDLSNCPNLQSAEIRNNNFLTSFTANGLSDFIGLFVYDNPALISISANNCPSLDQVWDIYGNTSLENLDISNCPSFIELYLGPNSGLNLPTLKNINLSNCTNINSIWFLLEPNSDLETLNIDGCSSLQTLTIHNSNLQTINFPTNLTSLQIININNSSLATLSVSNLPVLTDILVPNSLLSSINIVNLPNLYVVDLENNQLQTLDLSGASSLYNYGIYLNGNPMSYLNIKNGVNEQVFSLPTLTLEYVCVDESQLTNVASLVAATTTVSPYCTFTPGGDYNTINGSVTYDVDNNGCDTNDYTQAYVRVNVTDGTNQSAVFTNSSGNYSAYTLAGNFSVSPQIENVTFFTVSPAVGNITFANNNNNIATQDFCISGLDVHPDLEIIIAPVFPSRPGFDAEYKIVYRNKGNFPLSQQNGITFSFDANSMDFIASSVLPSQTAVGSLSWDYSNLRPFESREIRVRFNINAPTDSNPVNIGDILTFTATILPQVGDENTGDNVYVYDEIVVGSYDPNDITCLEGDVVSPSEIGNYLHYMIRFENTGTAEAENVVVRTEVDAIDFDINSLQLLNTSHPVNARITGNIVEFIFQNILLESGGHGNVLLKVKSKSNLQQGDSVKKFANIYFDYNFPITTNEAETTFQALNNPDFDQDLSISLYPNPTKDKVYINGENSLQSIQLYDVQGRLLQTQLVEGNQTSIDIATQSNGVYFIKVTSAKGIKVGKVVKE